MQRKRVGIVIFPDVEVLDFCGPYEVFSVARLDETKRLEETSPFEVFLVAEGGDLIATRGGMKVLPDHTFASCPTLDILVVPGGFGTRRESQNPVMLTWLGERAKEVETLTSVCTGSMLLGHAGLLRRLHATTHWRWLEPMRDTFPDTVVEFQQHVIEDGHVVTSAGISAGIDMALVVVMRYFGESIGRETARHMEYPFPDNNARRVQL